MLFPNGQYICASSLTSGLVDGQIFIRYAVSAFRWFFTCIACLISSVIIHSEMSVHDTLALMLSFISAISWFLFHSGFVITSIPPCRVLGCPCKWCICCFDVCIVGCIGIIVIVLLHLFWIWLLLVCGQWLCWHHGWNSTDGIFLIHVVCQVLLLQSCWIWFLLYIELCWQGHGV